MDIKTSLLRSFGDLRDIKKNLFLSNFIGLYLFEDVYTKHDTDGMNLENNVHSYNCGSDNLYVVVYKTYPSIFYLSCTYPILKGYHKQIYIQFLIE